MTMYPPSSANNNELTPYQYHDPPLPAPNRINLPDFQYPDLFNGQKVLQITEEEQKQRLPQRADFSQFSTKIFCRRCKRVSMTNVQLEAGTATWVWCLLLLPLGCAGCCCVCLDNCKDRVHYCSCGDQAGKRKTTIC